MVVILTEYWKMLKLLTFLNMFTTVRANDLPARITIYDSANDIVFPENKGGEITLNAYLISMTEILSTSSSDGKVFYL